MSNNQLLQQVSSPFTFTPEELAELIDPKDILKLAQYNGLRGIIKGLHVNEKTGLKSG
jgi:Ca2+-transporting ATPase